MKIQKTNLILVGIESRTFDGKTRYNAYFNELIDKESGYRSFSMNVNDELLSVLQKVGIGKTFPCVLAENKRQARSNGAFADYVTEFSIVPLI